MSDFEEYKKSLEEFAEATDKVIESSIKVKRSFERLNQTHNQLFKDLSDHGIEVELENRKKLRI